MTVWFYENMTVEEGIKKSIEGGYRRWSENRKVVEIKAETMECALTERGQSIFGRNHFRSR